MAYSEEKITELADNFGKDRSKTFAEFIVDVFKDKFVEIYLGDSYEEISVDQISQAYPSVFCGKVVAAYKECLVINAAYMDSGKQIKLGRLMFISERAIRALSEVDGNGKMEDMFLRSRESIEVKEHIMDGKPFGKKK